MKRTADTSFSPDRGSYVFTPVPGGPPARHPATSTPPGQANPQNPPGIASSTDRTGTTLLAARALQNAIAASANAAAAQNYQIVLSSLEGSYLSGIISTISEGTAAWIKKACSLTGPNKTLFHLESLFCLTYHLGGAGDWNGIVEKLITGLGIDFLLNQKWASRNTALHLLACIQDGKWLERALATESGKQSLVLQNSIGLTALHCAAKHGRKKAVQLILAHDDAGLISIIPSKNGKTALHLACGNNHESVVELLLSHKGTERRLVRDKDWWLPIHSAVGWGSGSDVLPHLLAKCGAEQIAARTKDGHNALMMAADYGLAPAVEMLLAVPGALAAQLDARDNDGKGAIDHARSSGNPDVIARIEAAMQTLSATSSSTSTTSSISTSTSTAPLASTVNQGPAPAAPFPPAANEPNSSSAEKNGDAH